MLFRNRRRLHAPEIESRFGDLYCQYEDRWPYWEVVLMLQKMFLTGAMCAIAPGSPIQLLVALCICLAYLVLLVYGGPYKGIL